MATITCPHCNKQFDFDDSEVSEILEHARAEARDHALAEAKAAAERELAAARATAERELKAAREAADREREAAVRQAASDERLAQTKAQQDAAAQIAQLQSQLAQERASAKANEELSRAQAQRDLEAQTAELRRQVAELQAQARSQAEAAQAKLDLAVREAVNASERHVTELEQQIRAKDLERESAVANTRVELEAKVNSVREDLERQRSESERRIREKDEEIGFLRDMKMRLSTKMLGESLEKHCENEFNKIRATAFPDAYFEKDNRAVADEDESHGTKGDYVFRLNAADGQTELLSIMFEMKTEQEDVKKGKTNESHLKKLDADRTKKNCEYAVLVSTLEPESDLYNQGIVDVSYRYPKMYVIRPQFFIPLLTMLSSAARKSEDALTELAEVNRQNIDVTTFEGKLHDFQVAFGKNVERGDKYLTKAIDDIDKGIKRLEAVRKDLVTVQKQFGHADDKLQGITIRKLTRGNDTMKALFEEARSAKVEDPDDGDEGLSPDSIE